MFSEQTEETAVLSEEPEVELSDENIPEEAEVSEPQDEEPEETVDIADEENVDEETVDITDETIPEEEEETEDSVFSDGGAEISTQADYLDIVDSEIPEIKIGETTHVTTENSAFTYCKFTAPEDGFYVFSPMNQYTYAYQKESGSEEVTYFDAGLSFGNKAYDRRGFSLKKGTTYYFELRGTFDLGYDDKGEVISSYSADITVQKVATVTSLKVDMSNVATSVWEKVQNLSCEGITYTVTYSDGESFTKTTDVYSGGAIEDRYGYEIGPKYKIGDEILDYGGSGVAPGTYQVLFYWGGMRIEQVEGDVHDIEVKSLSELPELKVGSINTEFESPEDRRAFYQFTTGAAGKYEIYPVGNLFFVYKNENDYMREIKPKYPQMEATDKGWRNCYELEENTTYMIQTSGGVKADINSDEEEYKTDLMVRRIPEVKNIKITAGNVSFAENWNYAYLLDGKMTVTYDEGNPVEFSLNVKKSDIKDTYGHIFSYYLKKDGEYFGPSNGAHKAGTYQLVVSCGNDNFEQDVTVRILSRNELPELKLGKNENIYKPAVTEGDIRSYYAWYRFTPEKNGLYKIGNASDLVEAGYLIWENGPVYNARYTSGADGKSFYLDAGTTYYIAVAKLNAFATESLTITRDFSKESTANLEKEIDNMLDASTGSMTEDETEAANDLLYAIASRDVNELYKGENIGSLVSKADALALKVNKQIAATQYEVAEDLPEEYKNIKVAGVNLTVLKAVRDSAEDNQVFVAKVKVEKADKTDNFDRRFSWKLTLSIVDVNTNKVVEDNVKLETPVQITMAIPAEYDAVKRTSTHVSYWNEDDSSQDRVYYEYDEQTKDITFAVPTFGSYLLSQCSHLDLSDWNVVEEPSCATPGREKCSCNICYDDVYQEIPATGKHDYSKVLERKDPTCTEAGYEKLECSSCGETTTKVLEPTGGHESSTWVVKKAATALAEGEMAAPCKYCGKILGTKKIPKLKPTMNMSVAANKTITLKVKQSFTVSVSGLAKGDKVASFTSSKKDIATVTAGGKITGKKAGTTVITVKLASGYSASFKVKVQKGNVKTTSITVLNKATGRKMAAKMTLKAKQKLTLQTKIAPVTSTEKVTYTSSNKKVATVTSKGVITAKKKGTATVTVKSGSKSYKIKITVK